MFCIIKSKCILNKSSDRELTTINTAAPNVCKSNFVRFPKKLSNQSQALWIDFPPI